ncbi:MAG TPA: DUF1488 family protein [Stellaceae bacterium]|jgi:hypothetical protein|nr:DUF1488 family protein [Stellaceae bacterium]
MFVFPDDASWNDDEDAVEFSIRLGDYEGKVFLPRRVLQSLIGARPKAEDCIAHFHLNRTAFERIAEARVHARQLDDDANIRITGRDLRAFRRS